MKNTLDSGAAVWTAGLAGILGFDAYLVTHRHPSLSSHAGAHPAVTGGLLGYLALHLLGHHFLPARVCQADPLGAIANRLVRRAA